MQNFIDTNRHEPQKKSVAARVRGFDEIYRFYNMAQAASQAERCIQCGDPFCAALGCPLGNAIPQWLGAIADDDLETAFLLSNETSPFPEILGRICPQSRLCEGACTLEDGYGAITIGAIEASITDLAFAHGFELPFPGIRHKQRVAVIGSGPAGFSCAHFLLRAGIGVDMFERSSIPGGLMAIGIPNFKLDKEIVQRRFEILTRAGLTLHLNREVGREVAFEQLLEDYDAVFLGVGACGGQLPKLAHERHGSVFLAMEFLSEVQTRLSGGKMHRRFDVRGRRVVVIGGGDTAMDCVRTAIREGAETVTCVYRRDEENMPGSRKEYHNAVEEGAEFFFLRSPTRIVVNDDARLTGIEVIRTRLSNADESGRRRVETVEKSEHCILGDILILALGFDVEEFDFLSKAGIATEKRCLQIDAESGRTSHPKVYAGGDCSRGAHLAVTAAADGRRAAFDIMERLLGEAP
jgi:glutamate synthase (NADPH/NADH) small chain